MGRNTTQLTAPFPYMGGKSRFAKLILPRLGNPRDYSHMVFCEPFAGSLAILLANPTPFGREIVTDTNGLISNFWRSMQAAPDEVAAWADFPTFHDDLHARHLWLVRWAAEHRDAIWNDADFCDPKAAGWWAWGQSSWVGGGWCAAAESDSEVHDKRPHISKHPGGGAIVQAQSLTIPAVLDIRPFASVLNTGQGVQAQRQGGPKIKESRPVSKGEFGGLGINAQSRQLSGAIGTGARLLPWFRALQERIARVVVLNRPWESAVTPTLLMQHYDGCRGVRIIMDPPYRTDTGRSQGIYHGDAQATDVATAAYDWAVAHGDRYGIVYFCHDGDFALPAGWEAIYLSFSQGRPGSRDMAMLSLALSESRPAQRRLIA